MLQSKNTLAIPPGYTIKEQLKVKGMMQKEFAQRMDLSEKHISHLINGKVELTQDVALRLEYVLGISAGFWNNLEAIYREKLLKVKEENELEEEINLLPLFPYSKMMSLGWIEKTKNDIERVLHLRRFFEVAKLCVIKDLSIPGIAYRKLNTKEIKNFDLAVWAQKARIESRNYQVSEVNIDKLKELIPKVRSLTVLKPDEFGPELIELMKSCGIALVFLPHLDGSFLHGATFVDGSKIVIGLTVRGAYADKFWFSLFHELYHIIAGHVYHDQALSDEDEHNANCFARDTLISLDDYRKLLEIGSYNDIFVYRFARTINIAPGIVVGRLQNDKIIGFNQLNKLREKYIINS